MFTADDLGKLILLSYWGPMLLLMAFALWAVWKWLPFGKAAKAVAALAVLVAVPALFILPLFQVVLGGDSLPVRKPDPAPLFRVLADLGAPRAVYVGDSEVDAATAQAAAMPFALFTEGYRKTPVEALPHDVAFSDFTDLPAIVERLA